MSPGTQPLLEPRERAVALLRRLLASPDENLADGPRASLIDTDERQSQQATARAVGDEGVMRCHVRMRIILSDFISLDGVVQAPGGQREDPDGGFRHGGWSGRFFDTEAMGPVLGEVMAQTEALLFGRRTWDVMASAWPGRAGDPFADQMNAIPKYVVSRTLTAEEASSRWNNTTLISDDDAVGAIRRLRGRAGDGAIQVMGSASLARQLVESDLVDEYRLMLEPILLGGGKTIFPSDGQARPLDLTSVTQAKTGVLICAYRPAAA